MSKGWEQFRYREPFTAEIVSEFMNRAEQCGYEMELSQESVDALHEQWTMCGGHYKFFALSAIGGLGVGKNLARPYAYLFASCDRVLASRGKTVLECFTEIVNGPQKASRNGATKWISTINEVIPDIGVLPRTFQPSGHTNVTKIPGMPKPQVVVDQMGNQKLLFEIRRFS